MCMREHELGFGFCVSFTAPRVFRVFDLVKGFEVLDGTRSLRNVEGFFFFFFFASASEKGLRR